MRIELSSVMVDDQEKALAFYTDVLGFEKKMDIPMGEFRWLTVTSREQPDGPQLVLEPNAHPAAATYQAALKADGIPATALAVDDLADVYERMTTAGVVFKGPPAEGGGVKMASFDDTCGNWIQLYQQG